MQSMFAREKEMKIKNFKLVKLVLIYQRQIYVVKVFFLGLQRKFADANFIVRILYEIATVLAIKFRCLLCPLIIPLKILLPCFRCSAHLS